MQLHPVIHEERRVVDDASPLCGRQLDTIVLDEFTLERAAKALFELVFSRTERLDGKHVWTNCDEEIKHGFRQEAMAVILAICPSAQSTD